MTKAVIFDCFGVLIGDAYAVIRRQFPELSDAIVALGVKSNLGEITSEERRRQVEKLLDSIGENGQKILGEAIEGLKRNDELLDEIKKLRQKYKTGLLSNAGSGFWRRFSREELSEYFDAVVLSYEVGLIKPDPRIYDLAAERLGIQMSECVFVDDDERNVRAAEGCGMKGVVYEWGMDVESRI